MNLIDVECPICQEILQIPVVIPCGHVFCLICLENWRSLKSECPMCKQKIPFTIEFSCCRFIENMITQIKESKSSSNNTRSSSASNSKTDPITIDVEVNPDNEIPLWNNKRIRTTQTKLVATVSNPPPTSNKDQIGGIQEKGVCDQCIKKIAFGYETTKEEMDCSTTTCLMFLDRNNDSNLLTTKNSLLYFKKNTPN
jgi:hypothetical protein